MKVLIVDDSKAWRDSTLIYLKIHAFKQHQYLEASSVSDALKLLSEHDFEVIVTDWEMPNGNGDVLLNHLIGKNWLKPIFVISSSVNIPRHSYTRPNIVFYDKPSFAVAVEEIIKYL